MKTIGIFRVLCTGAFLFAINANAQEMTKRIILGSVNSFITAPVWIAENRGYFKEESLDVRIREFDHGKAAMNTLLSSKDLDICTVAPTPIVFHSFVRNDFLIISSMVYTDNILKVLARQDKGIKSPLDLIGKRVGVTKGSNGQYFLDLFFAFNSIVPSKVETIDLSPAELPPALVDGRVDAICIWEPHIRSTQKLLGKKALVLPSDGIYRGDFFFVARKNYVKNNPETIERFLKSIEKAEEFIQENEGESIDIVSERLGLDKELTASTRNLYSFSLTLDQATLMSLEDVARWAIKKKITDKKDVPNYLDFMYLDALEKTKPEAITIIR